MTDIIMQNDLSSFNCPQLFVQFKWRLKNLECGQVLGFSFSKEQEIEDVVRYLDQSSYRYQILDSEDQICILVERICV